jgi:hypothetical protein
MSADVTYRIEYSLKVSTDGGEEFREIGFGAADARTVDAAAYAVETDLQRREWETEPGMPDPTEVDA